MITFEHVTYTYPEGARPALQDVNLCLPEGMFSLIIGPSGAGKSTLLRCINGLVPHFSGGALQGNIVVFGLDPVQATPQVISHHVGFVFQDPEAQFVMDQVEDEIAFALENAAMPRQEMRVRVEEALDLLDLAALRDRRLDTLSGGERQRVAIAAALALHPQVLVLDEPTSQLDPKSAEDVLHSLARLNSDLGLTIVLVEHRLERVLPFTDHLVYLSETGTVVATRCVAGRRIGASPGDTGQSIGLGSTPFDGQGRAAVQSDDRKSAHGTWRPEAGDRQVIRSAVNAVRCRAVSADARRGGGIQWTPCLAWCRPRRAVGRDCGAYGAQWVGQDDVA
jgi:energy-coupling factor transporter ATP-binding protein EcfA2